MKPKTEPKPEANADPKPKANAEPKPEAKSEPKPEANADVTTLMNTTLGDVLLAGLAKDPENVGRIVAAAITQAEASIAATKAPEADAKPDAKAAAV
jgi:ribonuclease E